MSHPPSSQRNLTLTEELEKLEQSITLTLQEIDSNFSEAHRIVTSSIIPTVEQYAEQSKDVWEASKFWKQFFESSANVSLSGYEEQPPSESGGGYDNTVTDDSLNSTGNSTLQDESESYATPSSEHLQPGHQVGEGNNPDISSLSLSPSHSSTPRARTRTKKENDDSDDDDLTASFIETPSFATMKQDAPSADSPFNIADATPRTPSKGKQPIYNEAMTPGSPSIILDPMSHSKFAASQKGNKSTDPLLHRVLDKTYRIQATPLASSRKRTIPAAGNKGDYGTATPIKSRYKVDDSPLSSPELEAPKLHPEIFASPAVQRSERKRNQKKPRTPGVNILSTPSNKPRIKANIGGSDEEFTAAYDDDTELGDFSPPKTMQFHIPQSQLLKTPAKEASKRIVSDLLHTAGGDDLTDDYDDIYDEHTNSPNLVRRARLEDETF